MARSTNTIVQYLRRAVTQPDTDEELLQRFASRRDEAAFAALVARHGAMVWGVCRRVACNHHDAEDAFQATFLVLANKAASIASRALLANWLYGVAHNTALKARAVAVRRRLREKQVVEMPERAVAEPGAWNDLQPLLDQELARLPDKYRVVVLCDLEGMTRRKAAERLGVAEGTIASRLARARAMLAKRLARHGLAVAGGPLALVLLRNAASAGVPASLASSTIRAASLGAAGLVSPQVVALTKGVLKSMLLTKLKIATVVLLLAGLLAFSAGTLIVPKAAGGEKELPRVASVQAAEPLLVQVRIANPVGMKVSVWPGKGEVVAPGRLDLSQGERYRLKLFDIPNRPGLQRFPTVEIAKADAATAAFLSSSAIPIELRDADFDRVEAGEAITKVIYLPAPSKGEPTTIASYDCDRDVIEEAKRRGRILAIMRMGNIDLGQNKDRLRRQRSEEGVKLVEVVVGDDGTQGRVVRFPQPKKADALAREKAKSEALSKKLEDAERMVRSLQTALARKEAELQKLRKTKDGGGK